MKLLEEIRKALKNGMVPMLEVLAFNAKEKPPSYGRLDKRLIYSEQ